MKRLLWIAAMLVFALGLLAQQQAPPPYDPQPAPGQTPPTFPEDPNAGAGRTPPETPPATKAPPPRELSSSEIQDQIQSKLNSEPQLENARVTVSVTDSEVTVSGNVDSEAERDLALRVVESYAGDRRIVDKLEIMGKA